MAASAFAGFAEHFEQFDEVTVGLAHQPVPGLGRLLAITVEHDGASFARYPAPAGTPDCAVEALQACTAQTPDEDLHDGALAALAEEHGFSLDASDECVVVRHEVSGEFMRHPATGHGLEAALLHVQQYLNAVGWLEGTLLRRCPSCGEEKTLREFATARGLLPVCRDDWERDVDESRLATESAADGQSTRSSKRPEAS